MYIKKMSSGVRFLVGGITVYVVGDLLNRHRAAIFHKTIILSKKLWKILTAHGFDPGISPLTAER